MNPIPAHLSYSTLMSWERCPHQYLLQKVAEVPQKPAVYFAGGTAVHLMTEALDTGQAPPGAKFEDYFYPEVERLMEANDGLYWDHKKWLAGNDTLDDWLTIGPTCVENWRKKSKWPGGAVEMDVTGSLPGCPVPIKAFIDRKAFDTVTYPGVVDIKTGKSKPKDLLQLETYVTLYATKTGMTGPIGAAFFMAREGKMTRTQHIEPAPEALGERYGKVYAEMVEADKTGEYPAKREFTCKWCPVQDSCLAWAGDTKMAKANDPYYEQGKPVY